MTIDNYFPEDRRLEQRLSLRVNLLLCLCILFSLSQNSVAAVPAGIQVSLTSAQADYDAHESIYVQVTYRNVTDEPIRLLIWGTALEGRINDDFLSILHEGVELSYSGRHYKRAAPQESDYVIIAAGTSVSATVNIATGYNVVFRGEYVIRPKAEFGTYATTQEQAGLTVRLNSDRLIAYKQTPLFSNCSSTRQNLTDSALSAAESITRRARDDLRNTPVSQRANARRYQEWFGVYDDSRWNSVQRNFDALYAAVSGRRITFICDDTSDAYAYVYTNDPYKIYLGRAFWNAPRTGTDSKAGTIVHELSHFNVVAATDDVVYGQSGARNLARSNPGQAIRNADSHEYFAENTPNLSMPPPGSAEAPDLLISALALSAVELRINSVFTVQSTVRNSGNAASTASFLSVKLSSDSRISQSDPQLLQAIVSGLDAGGQQEIELEAQAPEDEGDYWVGVCVLPSTGENETDNNCSVGVKITAIKPLPLAPLFLLLQDE